MLHRVALRRSRSTELLLCLSLAVLLAVGLSVFWWFYAPNWDVCLLHIAAAVVLSLPLPALLVGFFGQRVLQVEHAGVVVGTAVWGRALRFKVWRAEQVRAFDWEPAGDGGYVLRLLLLRTPTERPAFQTVMYTDSAYQLAAVWRDLELHYPGSGLRADLPEAESEGGGAWAFRLCGALAMLLGVGMAAATWTPMLTPLRVAGHGVTTPAEITALVWDSSAQGSPYHLEARPAGADKVFRSASSFPQTARLPQQGQLIPVVWAPTGPTVFYVTDEVLPFLLPLPLACGWLLLILSGARQLLQPKKARL